MCSKYADSPQPWLLPTFAIEHNFDCVLTEHMFWMWGWDFANTHASLPLHTMIKINNDYMPSIHFLAFHANSKGSCENEQMHMFIWALAIENKMFFSFSLLLLFSYLCKPTIFHLIKYFPISVVCWYFLQTVWFQIKSDKMSGLIWIQFFLTLMVFLKVLFKYVDFKN